MKQTFRFPNNFLWGAACASYQVEGGINNCDWSEAAKKGGVPFCGPACDHYNRYESDFDIVQKLGQNCHRLSIEWSRIEPHEGRINKEAVIHYRNVINALRMRGIEPFVTLWHFTLPVWFEKRGGFERADSVEIFRRYAQFVAKEILIDEKYIQTINAPMIWASQGYFRGVWPPFKKDLFVYWKVVNNLIKAHRAAYVAIKKERPNIFVGIDKNNIFFKAGGFNPYYYIKTALARYWWNHRFLDKIDSKLDFICINYYFYKPQGYKHPLPKSDMGWDIFPEGIYHVLMELKRYDKPVYITENGIADAKDLKRGKFIQDHLFQIHRAIQKGIDVRGYMYWSLMDNYEWIYGFEKRFGLIEINYTTQERRVRPSAYVYKNICETNSLELEVGSEIN